ncbi:MAG: hypothetical protein LBV08_04825 [Clostridiales bacterium]|jgi:hypothetical protein|nr:hypothetical protein [Clostridiales bacterium]
MKNKELYKVLICYLILYLSHFYFPSLFPTLIDIYRDNQGDGISNVYWMLLCSTVIFTFIGIFKLPDKISYWFLGLILYIALTILCLPNGLFWIIRKFSIFNAFSYCKIFLVSTIIPQFLILSAFKFIRYKKRNYYEIYLVMIIDIILYITNFIIIPLIPSGYGNLELFAWLILPNITLASMILITDKMRFWLIGSILHVVLICSYYPNGIYGIGMGFFYGLMSPEYKFVSIFTESRSAFDSLGFIVYFILFIFSQFSVWLAIKAVKLIIYISKKLTNEDTTDIEKEE